MTSRKPSTPNSDDSIDVNEVARLLGLSSRTSVGTYMWRYPDMPRPVAPGGGRRLGRWSRSELLAWKSTKKFRSRGKSAR